MKWPLALLMALAGMGTAVANEPTPGCQPQEHWEMTTGGPMSDEERKRWLHKCIRHYHIDSENKDWHDHKGECAEYEHTTWGDWCHPEGE